VARGQHDEGGGRWVGVGRSFQKKKLRVMGGPKNNCATEKKKQKGKKNTDQVNCHPIHEIPEQDFLDGAPVGAGSLKPNKMPLSKLVVAEVFTIE
jgi:hypothetical protein